MTSGRTRFRRELALVAGVAALLAVAFTDSGVLWRWDRVAYDRLSLLAHAPPPDDVVIVAADEGSLAELGRWPWSRRVHAALVDRLTDAGARAVALGILFSEPDSAPGSDADLARALRDNGRVVLPVLAEAARAGGRLKETLPVPAIADAAAGLGHVDMEVDADGIVRSTFARAGLGGAYWPVLAEVLGRVAGDPWAASAPPAPPHSGKASYEWVREGHVLIPFAGPPGHFPRVPYVDVLRGDVGEEVLRGRVVLVGVTAAGVGGGMATPVSGGSTTMPAVEVLANVYAGMREGRSVVPLSGPWSGALAVVLVLLPCWVYVRARGLGMVLMGLLGVALPVLVSATLLLVGRAWWPPLGAATANLLVFVAWNWRRLEVARRQVLDARQRAEVTLRCIGDAVVTTDLGGRIDYMNPVAEALTGWNALEATGRKLDEVVCLFDDGEGPEGTLPVPLALPAPDSVRATSATSAVTLLGRGGREHGVQASIAQIRDAAGSPYGMVFALRDVTDARRLEREMAHQATHDLLTDLPNRSLLLDRLAGAVARAERSGTFVAVLFVDVDRFKTVNDGFGHGVGDHLLQAVARRLCDSGRAEDTVARLGGDEFVALLEGLHESAGLSGIARKFLDAVARPYEIDDHEFHVTASIGVSVYPRDARDAQGLLKAADIAMYRAKDSGRNSVQFFSADLNRRIVHRIELERRLRRAIADGVLELHYQPLVSFATERVAGTEALLRWMDPGNGYVSPLEFVSVAEESGLIVPLGEWVLETACRQARLWDEAGIPPLRVSVNVSPRQLLRQNVTQVVERVLGQTGLAPERLELEITESVMMQETGVYERVLNEIKELGVHLAIDDFGTGYSSLSYLKRFPVNRVKIDQSFVRDIGVGGEGVAISRAVIAMARSLELSVVAEGVENQAQADFLRARGCDEGQGFHLCPPVPPHELASRLAADGRLMPVADPTTRPPLQVEST